jgi:hypothetical protein
VSERQEAVEQIHKLATWILENVPGEPSHDEGAVDCAIRIMAADRLAEEKAREALEWYKERAVAIADYADPQSERGKRIKGDPNYAMAIYAELTIDKGKRADEALRLLEAR